MPDYCIKTHKPHPKQVMNVISKRTRNNCIKTHKPHPKQEMNVISKRTRNAWLLYQNPQATPKAGNEYN